MTESQTRIRITTTDATFAMRYGNGLGDDGGTVIAVDSDSIERVRFAGHDMIRFDMLLVGAMPKDWANRYTMYPATRLV